MDFMTPLFALPFVALLTTAAPQVPDSRPVVLAFGDSITAGFGVGPDQAYPAQLQRELDAKGYRYRVVSQGVSGSTTVGGLGRLTRALGVNAHVVILQFGGNDPGAGISADATRENLRKMITRFRSGGTRVILASRGKNFSDLAEPGKVDVVDLMEGLRDKPGLLQPDGAHPTAEGHSLLVKNLLRVLEPILRRATPRASQP